MLVLNRKIGEELIVGDRIILVVHRITGNRVILGINAPDNDHIVRGELQSFFDEFRDNSETRSSEPV